MSESAELGRALQVKPSGTAPSARQCRFDNKPNRTLYSLRAVTSSDSLLATVVAVIHCS